MNFFVALASEFWWIAPIAAGAGTLGAVGVRWRSRATGRRLGVDAARLDLRAAQDEAVARKVAVKVARAEHTRLVAERARGASVDHGASRRASKDAERAAKAADAAVRARRAQLDAARAEMSVARRPEHLPLARVQRAHDAVTARWMAYETDPAKLIAYPAMSDVRNPWTAAFLATVDRAQSLRPTAGERVTPAEYGAYRDAVGRLRRAFDAAELHAQGGAEAADGDSRMPGWQETAQDVLSRSSDALDRAAGAATSAIAAWNARRRGPKNGPSA